MNDQDTLCTILDGDQVVDVVQTPTGERKFRIRWVDDDFCTWELEQSLPRWFIDPFLKLRGLPLHVPTVASIEHLDPSESTLPDNSEAFIFMPHILDEIAKLRLKEECYKSEIQIEEFLTGFANVNRIYLLQELGHCFVFLSLPKMNKIYAANGTNALFQEEIKQHLSYITGGKKLSMTYYRPQQPTQHDSAAAITIVVEWIRQLNSGESLDAIRAPILLLDLIKSNLSKIKLQPGDKRSRLVRCTLCGQVFAGCAGLAAHSRQFHNEPDILMEKRTHKRRSVSPKHKARSPKQMDRVDRAHHQ